MKHSTEPQRADWREIVPGTLEVYPLGEFGLLEICTHRFCRTENGKQECGTFQNMMIWRREGTGYMMSRVISYDHRDAVPLSPRFRMCSTETSPHKKTSTRFIRPSAS